MSPLEQAQIDFENEGGETYICGNPPYLGSQGQSTEQKEDLHRIFDGRTNGWKSLDYVAGWFMKAADYGLHTPTVSAFVSTNSICQGRQVDTLWPLIFQTSHQISFAHTSFKWSNLASHNAGVTVVIIGISNNANTVRKLYSLTPENSVTVKECDNINPYLISGPNVIVRSASKPLCGQSELNFGNMPNDGGHLLLDPAHAREATDRLNIPAKFIRSFVGSQGLINGIERKCIWVSGNEVDEAQQHQWLKERFEAVREHRAASSRATTKNLAAFPHRFGEVRQNGNELCVVVPRHSSENREYLPFALVERGSIAADSAFAFFDPPLWLVSVFASRMHLMWIATVCGKIKTDYRYSNTLGWNTFPVPKLTEKNKADLTVAAENILLAREAHFPATIADLYNPDTMPENLRAAHAHNDEVLERIYIGRRFRNDTERLEKLFEMYTKLTTKVPA